MYRLLEYIDRSYGISVAGEPTIRVLTPVVPASWPVACSTRGTGLGRPGLVQVLRVEAGVLLQVLLLHASRPLRDLLASVASYATALLGLLFDAAHISYDEASSLVSDDVIGSLPCNLVVEVPECQAGLALYALLCRYEPAVLARAVLCSGELPLESAYGLVPLPLDRPALSAVDDRDVDGAVVHEGGECHRVDDALVYGGDRLACRDRTARCVGDVQREPPRKLWRLFRLEGEEECPRQGGGPRSRRKNRGWLPSGGTPMS